jgi:hypothetical protein
MALAKWSSAADTFYDVIDQGERSGVCPPAASEAVGRRFDVGWMLGRIDS